MPRLNSRFFSSFLIILLATLIPLATFFFIPQNGASPDAHAQAARLAAELDRLLDLRLDETFTIAALPSLRAFAASDPLARAQRATVASNEIQAWVSADSQLREVFMIDRRGTTILTTGKNSNQNWSPRAFAKNALDGKLDVSAPSRDAGEISQYYAAPILDNGGNVAGALVARIAAQELWQPVKTASNGGSLALLVDENGVRLADGGESPRLLTSLAPLSNAQQTRVVNEQTYGAQVTLVPATNLTRAAQQIQAGALDSLNANDFGARKVGAQRLSFKPWTTLVLTQESFAINSAKILLPLIVALASALVAAWMLAR